MTSLLQIVRSRALVVLMLGHFSNDMLGGVLPVLKANLEAVGLRLVGAQAAREAADSATSELRIGAVTTAGEHIAPQLMQTFAARHPEVALSVDVGNRQRVFERLRTHRFDAMLNAWRTDVVSPERTSITVE